jgi:hypothetical protein
VEYDDGSEVRKVKGNGQFHYKGHAIFIGEGLIGESIAICPSNLDDVFDLFYCHKPLGSIDLRNVA